MRAEETGHFPLEKAFELFYQGVSLNGPYWDHVLLEGNLEAAQEDTVLEIRGFERTILCSMWKDLPSL